MLAGLDGAGPAPIIMQPLQLTPASRPLRGKAPVVAALPSTQVRAATGLRYACPKPTVGRPDRWSRGAVVAAGLVSAAQVARSRAQQRRPRCAVALERGTVTVAAAGAAEDPADVVSAFLEEEVPELLEVAGVEKSRAGSGLGLFARCDLKEGEEVYSWSFDSGNIMAPAITLSEKLATADFGALAFQVLRSQRVQQENTWGQWAQLPGVAAPDTHPLKLVLSDPDLARKVWNSTTCGGRMSAMALAMRDDLDEIKGSSPEEWAEVLALVMSRSLCEDEEGRPLLALGLELVQDAEDDNLTVEVRHTDVEDPRTGMRFRNLSEVVLTASRDIERGEELTMRYVPGPCGGKYLERFGYVPDRMRGLLGDGACELAFAPTDEDDDEFYDLKASLFEDLKLSTDPFSLTLTRNDIKYPEPGLDFSIAPVMDQMMQVLRFRHLGGRDAFLLDGVFIQQAWTNSQFRISKANEYEVCNSILEECERMLERFKSVDEPSETDSDFLKALADVRRQELEIVQELDAIITQERQDTELDETRIYFLDRQMDIAFERKESSARWEDKLPWLAK